LDCSAGARFKFTIPAAIHRDRTGQLSQYMYSRSAETLIDVSEEVGLEVNVEKTKCMLVSRDQNIDQNRDIRIGNISFENVLQFKYLGMDIKTQFVLHRRHITSPLQSPAS
jgi:hypothetical protein